MDRKQSTSSSSAADDIMSGLLFMFFVLLAVLFLAPSIIFAFIIVLTTRRLPWYITVVAMLICLGIGLGIVHHAGGVKPYLLLIANSFKAVLKTGSWKGFPWGAYIGSAFLLGPPLAVISLAVMPSLRLPGAPRMGSRTCARQTKGFVEKLMLDRLAKAKHPVNGTYLGISQNCTKNIMVSDKELNQHCFAIGTTGSGKTTTLLNFAESAIQRGLPTLYIDGKGEVKLVEQLKRLAERYGRKFYLFSVNDHPDGCRWNPLARGKPTELKDKLISITEWTEPHYRYEAERYLQAVFTLFEKLKMKPDIPSVAQYLYPKAVQNLAREIQDEYLRENLLEELRAGKTVEGLANRIAVLAASEIGDLFLGDEEASPIQVTKEKTVDLGGLLGLEQRQEYDAADAFTRATLARDERPILDLDRAIQEKAVVLFSLNSLRFREFSQLIGRLVVNDLRTTIARRYDFPERDYIFGIFDEFHVFASLQVVDILAQARGAGFCTIIATQSLSDLDLVDRDLTGRIVENCNTFIIQAQNYPENAERLASIIGTQDSIARTFQVEGHMVQLGTGLGSWREVKEFIVHPDEIKRLQRGEAIVVRKAGGFNVDKIWIRKPEMFS